MRRLRRFAAPQTEPPRKLARVMPPQLEEEVERRADRGTALPALVRRELEHGLGTPLGAVSLHTDERAASMAARLDARAFTVGRDVFFGHQVYDPSTAPGYRVLAHEMAHVLQGSAAPARSPLTVSEPADRDERDAERAADYVTERHVTGTGPTPALTLTRGTASVRRNGPDPANPTIRPEDTPEKIVEPAHRNQRIATWLGLHDSAVGTTSVVGETAMAAYPAFSAIASQIWRPGWTAGQYDTEAAAVGAIQATGNAGAVFVEGGRYVAYFVENYSLWYDFTWANVRWFADKPWTAVQFSDENTPLTIVLQDGVAIHAGHFKTKADAKTLMSDEGMMPGADSDPFAGYKAAFKDLNKPGIIELVVGPALRDFALSVLHRSRAAAERNIERYSSSGIVSQQEIELMTATAKTLAAVDEEQEHIPKTLPPDPVAHARFWELDAQRKQALARYPILARIDPRRFITLTREQQFTLLGGAMAKVITDIDETRANILDGTLNLWKIPSLVDSTIAGLGIDDPNLRKRVHEIAEANQTSVAETVLTLFTVVLGLASIVVTGPLGVAVAAGALGLGVADAIRQTEEIFAEHAAANTNPDDPSRSVLPPEEARSYGWLLVAWGGVVADGFQLLHAIKAVKAAGGALEAGVKALAKGDEEVAKQLRLAAGIADATEVISEAAKPGLARRLGTAIEIDALLGKDVRVVYHIDAEGRAVLDGIRCGPEATHGVILAHESTVKLLRRYDGVLGRVRELLEKFLSLGPARFPPGSQAFESFLEVKKLPDVIAVRRAALGTSIGTESEALLRRDIAFLENELARHQQVVEKMVLERGTGFVERASEKTAQAIKEGMPALEGNPLIKNPGAYYYRSAPGRIPPYVLVRFETAEAPRLTVVADGAGWKIAEASEATLTRAEEAAAIVGGWKQGFKDAYEKVVQAFTKDVFKVVPLKGVAATGMKMKDLMTATQQQELYAILLKAFAKDPDPAARATSAMTKLIEHDITLVKGTNQLRAYNYRLAFEKATGAAAEGDLHHLIPLYLGGENMTLVDMAEDLHKALHELIDQVRLADGVSLAPGAIGKSGLSFSEGAAVLYSDGRVQLVTLAENATYALVP